MFPGGCRTRWTLGFAKALEEALANDRGPEIFNTDQGSLPGLDPGITGADFTAVLIEGGVRIAMDGRGRWIYNVFIERVWRALNHADISIKATAFGREARTGIAEYFATYNERRLDPALGTGAAIAVWRHGAVQTCGHVANANVLSTGPQAEQHQQTKALAA